MRFAYLMAAIAFVVGTAAHADPQPPPKPLPHTQLVIDTTADIACFATPERTERSRWTFAALPSVQ